MFKTIRQVLSKVHPLKKDIKKEISTVYNVITKNHIAVFTPFASDVRISLLINEACHQRFRELKVRIIDPFEENLKVALKTVFYENSGQSISFSLSDCYVGMSYRLEIYAKEPCEEFDECYFTIYLNAI